MFQFPWFASCGLCIHPTMTGLHPGRVSPFGYPWINARLQLPMAFRSLPRPSSPSCAQASTSRPSSLDPLIKPSLLSHASSRNHHRQEKTVNPPTDPPDSRTHSFSQCAPRHFFLSLLIVKKQPSSFPRGPKILTELSGRVNGPRRAKSQVPSAIVSRRRRGPFYRSAASAANSLTRSSTGSRPARRSSAVGAISRFGSIPTPSNCDPSGK